MKGLFITFEGTEGCGKSTQVAILAERIRAQGRVVRALREPGGTPIGEEIRHTLKHSKDNAEMTPEAELLLMNASRAQLVREVIRPALAAGEVVVCDRFYDSTTAYQGYGRQMDLGTVQRIIEVAVAGTRPDLTLLLRVSPEVSWERLRARQAAMPVVRDRFEEADRGFFDRVARGYEAIAVAEPGRVKVVDGARPVDAVAAEIWSIVQPLLEDQR
ncbi:MAG TPA: dTMP kinase [Verrucomicrobia bacterium]|nr:dTMP kinase [Verrucomicrobiota bacterium]HOB32139.1 dTMP kinase [Verrucomicrobiota bacterium]HOP96276.1 dTMP kinase [Verrucomicrobiota bacterium]HPU56529.1 dTMP kinase [Verrucomicrobiota bacterium]